MWVWVWVWVCVWVCVGVGVWVLGCGDVGLWGCAFVYFRFWSHFGVIFCIFSMILVRFEVHFVTFLVSGWSLGGIKASSGAPWGSLGRQGAPNRVQ